MPCSLERGLIKNRETKFGDKYVVMHPADKRYKQYKHGKTIEIEWINGKVRATIIKDTSVDMKFGTGVMTITPWHDATDLDIAERHNLEKTQIIDARGLLLPIAKEFAGMHIKKARPLIVEKLKQKGLVEKIDEAYVHRIATNSRGGGIIEPQIMRQWFINVSTLKEKMIDVVKKGKIKIVPKRFEKTYFHWINNLRDWCISRQIWFGHQIPVWYRGQETYVGTEPPKGTDWAQDQDTLDTWFSSGLWTFSTLGWPEKTKDFETYHPTSLLETGYDILFFWVARMILMTTYLLQDVPFRTVYLHGLVRDDKGRKMSKSLGNIIDPLTMIEKYGADATRLSLIIGAAPGNDMKISEDKVRGYRNFANKIWNIARFVLLNIEDIPQKKKPILDKQEKKILGDFKIVKKETTKFIEEFRLSQAAEKLYHYLWHTFADTIVEESKPLLRPARQYVLLSILGDCIKMLHPFLPFVTEEIYQKLPLKNKKETLMVEQWPS